jgi:uncharacterized membrane protein YfcA
MLRNSFKNTNAEMDHMLEDLLLPLFGFLIGTVASMTGIGGGVFIVPLLTLVYAFVPANAVGTSLTTIIFTAFASTLNYSRQKRIFYKTGLILAITTAPGAVLGAYLTTVIPARELALIFGFFLFFVAAHMMVDISALRRRSSIQKKKPIRPTVKSDDEMLSSRKTLLMGAGLGFFGGLASGLLGIGGGILVVPIMTFTMYMPIHLATATSMVTMIFTSVSGVTQHYFADHIRFEYVLPLALGTVLGAQLGAYASKRISGTNLRRVFAIVLIVVSIQMITKYV